MKENRNRVGIALAVSLVLSFLCGFIIYHTMGFIYAIADDVIMRDIASGAFTGTPDGHLIFIQYVLGWFISRLYLLNGSVDWYGFFIAGALFLGLAAVLYRGLSSGWKLQKKVLYTGLVLGVFGTALLFHAAQFEWTISAAALGASALFLYVTMEANAERGQQILEGVLVWLLLFLTFGIRYDVFFMVMPGFGIAFLWKFVKRENRKLQFDVSKLVLPAAVFFTVGLVFLVEQMAYSGEDWDTFQNFQSARSQVYDYTGVPSYETNPTFFEELGLDEHEVRNLRHYALYLVDDMDADLMEALSQESQRQSAEATGIKAQLKSGIRLALEQLTGLEYWKVSLPTLFFAVLAVALAWKKQKGALVPFLLFWCAEGVLWLGLGFIGRLPERVATSMHLVQLLGSAGLCCKLWKQGEDRKFFQAAALVGMVVFCVTAGMEWDSSVQANASKRAMDENYQIFKENCKEKSESLFFIETYMAEPVGGASVTVNGDFRINRCLTLGDWYTTSPLDEERFEVLGIETVEKTLLENPNAYLVVRDAEEPGFYETYFGNKYPQTTLVCTEWIEIDGRMYYLYQVQQNQNEEEA